MLDLCKMNLTPHDIIVEFNKKTENEKLLNTIEVKRKISRLKYSLKPLCSLLPIANMTVQNYLHSKNVANMNSQELQSLPWDQPIVANFEIIGNGFVAFLTSKNLMMNILKQIAVGSLTKGADGTYKLNIEGHPTIVSGVYDAENKFHLSKITHYFIITFLAGFGITSQEDEWSYERVFAFEKELFHKCFPDVEYNPKYLMADGALYIHEGAFLVWENVTATLCSFHFFKSVKDKLCNKDYIPKVVIEDGKIGNKKVPKTLLEQFTSPSNISHDKKMNPTRILRQDIKVLQVLPNEELFNKYLKIIKPFWIYFGRKFWDYFYANYLNQSTSQCRSGWQNYIQENSVTTNNSLEAFNRVMKEVMTKYTQLPITNYLESLCEEVKGRSLEATIVVNFPMTPQSICQ